MGQIFLVVLLVAFILWLVSPGAKQQATPDDPVEPVDEAELEAAEREVQDLDVNQRPEDGFEGDDWGPGASGRR